MSRHKDLSGTGGLRAPGRWHNSGSPVVYLAEAPAGAVLEACVNTSANDVPPKYTLLAVRVSEQIRMEILDARGLRRDWIDHFEVTREIGTEWLNSQRSALLLVPSALVPASSNVLLNPLHPDAAKVRIEAAFEYPYDPRGKK
ncbi:MAG TPA: RES family NAD+ phosphorylase [Terriglobales bacterium]|nr:RES family NAD+ phosphorylase [Terriglobales bacterium]